MIRYVTLTAWVPSCVETKEIRGTKLKKVENFAEDLIILLFFLNERKKCISAWFIFSESLLVSTPFVTHAAFWETLVFEKKFGDFRKNNLVQISSADESHKMKKKPAKINYWLNFFLNIYYGNYLGFHASFSAKI